MSEIIKKLKTVPHKPGCYLMKDKKGTIIYVGKAKDLFKRLSSYFNRPHTGKTKALVDTIDIFDFMVTTTEKEALVLELNLIKKYDPKYNIMFTDDKSYPYIELTKEKYPRLLVVRNINRKKKNAYYFGPYPNTVAARKVVMLLNRLYPLRKCKTLNKDFCLYYHINECLGYCNKHIDQNVIDGLVSEITKFLKGDVKNVMVKLEEEMYEAAKHLNFEKASELKNLLVDVKLTTEKQKIDLNTNEDIDIFGYYDNKGYLSVQILFVRGGKIQSLSSTIVELVDTVTEEVYEFINKFYQKGFIPAKNIIVQDNDVKKDLESALDFNILIPEKGKKKKLLDLAIANAKENLKSNMEIIKNDEEKIYESLEALKKLLNLSSVNRIESFDNSHLFGKFTVSGMVVYINGKPAKKEYRKYNIMTEKGNSDTDIFKEVIYRRYFRVLKDNLEYPDLIIVDGGVNQINTARSVLLDLNLDIKVVGLKKDDQHNSCALLGDYPIRAYDIDKKSQLFHLLTRINEDTHNFVISHNINRRSKGALSSSLDLIPGLGIKRKKALLKKFGSLKQMKLASKDELLTILPVKVVEELLKVLAEI